MKVYRLEEIYGVGPYNTKIGLWHHDWYAEMMRVHQGTSHPNRAEDMLPDNENYLFGCDSIEGLESWFNGYIDYLLANGFNIMCYETEEYEVGISGKQLTFLPTKNKFIVEYSY